MTPEIAVVDQLRTPIEAVASRARRELLEAANAWEHAERTPIIGRENSSVWLIERFLENTRFIGHQFSLSPSFREFLLRTQTRVDLTIKFYHDNSNSIADMMLISVDQFGLKRYTCHYGDEYPHRGKILTDGEDLETNPQIIQTWLESKDQMSLDYLQDLAKRFARLSSAEILEKIWHMLNI